MNDPIVIGSRTFRVLFPDILRPLDDREREDLKASIARHGIRQRITVDEDGGVIDGWHRVTLAAELGLDHVPADTAKGLGDDQKRDLALDLNLSRRHLSAAELQRRRKDRIMRVAEAHKAGASSRTIANEVGVSRAQVRRDLEDAEEEIGPPGPIEPEGGRVTRSGGGTYPATRPAPPPDETDSQEDDTADDAPPLAEEEGPSREPAPKLTARVVTEDDGEIEEVDVPAAPPAGRSSRKARLLVGEVTPDQSRVNLRDEEGDVEPAATTGGPPPAFRASMKGFAVQDRAGAVLAYFRDEGQAEDWISYRDLEIRPAEVTEVAP